MQQFSQPSVFNLLTTPTVGVALRTVLSHLSPDAYVLMLNRRQPVANH